MFGQGVPRDRRKAIKWLMQAAKQGNGRAHWIAEWLNHPAATCQDAVREVK
jgi:TPR repeat protein